MSESLNTKVLVTGCGGFIGQYLVERLLQSNNIEVFGVDTPLKIQQTFPKSDLNTHKNFVKLPLDLTNMFDCSTLPEVDYVFHLAAINGTQLFYEIPWDVFYNSGLSTINLISRYKHSHRLKRFVYASSSEVYADLVALNDQKIKTDESSVVGFQDIFNPRWSYGGAKLLGEIGIVAAGSQFNLPFTILRYHNVYGPRMGINHVMPDFIERGKLGVFELYGSENIRSFIYVSDAVEASIIAGESDQSSGKVVHIGTMESISMLNLAQKIMTISNWEGEITIHPAPRGSTNFRCPDTSFLNNILGFEPQVTLDSGLSNLLIDKGVMHIHKA